jgi:hypothetical protein
MKIEIPKKINYVVASPFNAMWLLHAIVRPRALQKY